MAHAEGYTDAGQSHRFVFHRLWIVDHPLRGVRGDSATINYVSVFESRIWAPIFVPLTFLILVFVCEAGQQFGKYINKRTVNSILIGVVAIGLIYPLISTMSSAANLVAYGDGLGGEGWMSSETIQYIQKNPSECTYYSNGPDVIYFLDHINAKWVPSRGTELSI